LSRLAWLGVLAALLLASGCPAAHSGYPNKSCTGQADCYEGETCMLSNSGGTCVATDSDGGTP
jgi:hypothetical protein